MIPLFWKCPCCELVLRGEQTEEIWSKIFNHKCDKIGS